MWEPKSGKGKASVIVTLAVLRSIGPTPLHSAARVIVEKRKAMGFPEGSRMIRNHIHYLLKEGLLEPLTVNGAIYLKVSEKGVGLLQSLFSP